MVDVHPVGGDTEAGQPVTLGGEVLVIDVRTAAPRHRGTAAPLRAVREAVTDRATAERGVAQAVAAARDAGVSWAAIASTLGTSGEATRKRYAEHDAASA